MATRTGSAVIVEDARDVILAKPNAPGRITTALGGPLDEAKQSIRLGWARLPPLNKQQRLVVATRDLSVLFSPHELVTRVGSGSVESATSRLLAVAGQRGEDNIQLTVTDAHEDLTDACLTQVHTMFRTDDVRLRTPPPSRRHPVSSSIRSPPTMARFRWCMAASTDGWSAEHPTHRSRPPGITLLGPAGWHDVKSVRPRVPSRSPHHVASGANTFGPPPTSPRLSPPGFRGCCCGSDWLPSAWCWRFWWCSQPRAAHSLSG